jgi:hypothetical protein
MARPRDHICDSGAALPIRNEGASPCLLRRHSHAIPVLSAIGIMRQRDRCAIHVAFVSDEIVNDSRWPFSGGENMKNKAPRHATRACNRCSAVPWIRSSRHSRVSLMPVRVTPVWGVLAGGSLAGNVSSIASSRASSLPSRSGMTGLSAAAVRGRGAACP